MDDDVEEHSVGSWHSEGQVGQELKALLVEVVHVRVGTE